MACAHVLGLSIHATTQRVGNADALGGGHGEGFADFAPSRLREAVLLVKIPFHGDGCYSRDANGAKSGTRLC